MKRLLALTILALGLPTLMGAQVQEENGINAFNSMVPTDEDGDLCEKGITEYNGSKVLCSQAEFNNIASSNKYVLGKSFTILNHTTLNKNLSDFELDGRGNTLAFKGTMTGVNESNIRFVAIFKALLGESTIKNLSITQQSTYSISNEFSAQYNAYSAIAGRIEANAKNVKFENIKVEQSLSINHEQQAYIGGLAGYASVTNGASVEFTNIDVTSSVSREQTVNSVTDWAGGIVGDMIISGSNSKVSVTRSSLDSSYVLNKDFSTTSYSGGVFGRLENTSGSNINVNIDEVFSKYRTVQGRSANDSDTSKQQSTYTGGIVGQINATSTNPVVNISNSNVVANISTNASKNSYKHISGGIVGNVRMSITSNVTIDGSFISGNLTSGALTSSDIGGVIGVLDGSASADSSAIVKNIILSAPLSVSNSNDWRMAGRIVSRYADTKTLTMNSLFYLPSSTINVTPNNDLGELVQNDQVDFDFFVTRTTLNIDAWDIMPYTQFWNGNTLDLQLKRQVWAANPVNNNLPNTPTINVESFKFADGDRLSPIVWVVGAFIALLVGGYVWYKKRKSAY